MANLFWKTPKSMKSLLEVPFKTEEEFEKAVFAMPELLEDITLLKRQIRGGNKYGIPDVVGVDNNGNVCILELKNVPVDSSIIPQVLEYAIWAENNPDSIRTLWLDSNNKQEDIEPEWDNLEIRIIVVAPSIHRSTTQFISRVSYDIELLEIKRWVDGSNQLLMVNKVEDDEKRARVKPATGLQNYDEAFYLSTRNKTSASQFWQYATEVEKLIAKKKWKLETKFNKYDCVYKVGFFNAFSIRWTGTKTFAFSFKLPEKEAKKFGIPISHYISQRGRALYYVEPGKTKVNSFIPLFEHCYRRFAGNQPELT